MDTHKDLIEFTQKFTDEKLGCSHGDDEIDISYLPREIVQEILSRLPFKHVVRFQTVSKSWNAIISKLRFSRVHLRRSDGSHNLFLWRSYVSAHTRELLMDDLDFTIDHSDWKALLPSDKHEVLWKSASLGFSIEQKTGKNCFMLERQRLEMSQPHHEVSSGEFRRKWKLEHQSRSSRKPRFSEVAESVNDSDELVIRGVVKIEWLSPETLYAAYLVFTLTDNLELTNTCTRSFYGHSKEKAGGVNIYGPIAVSRGDGRMEVEIGELFVTKGDNNRDIEAVVLVHTEGLSVRGLTVEGIEFRPLGIQITSTVG
ncbi:hypothetical protein BUALT_Bualt14G0039400 [Buddleja alternifolia]|uniref:F-box domain-containing protein n=1 Tax=Buddleja alternifolia TaxID=168488 RepID=A0AAV6WHX3_9LAMI|nr:hypothetical protein BUALT_Bualt14G0039400 [Buddleja alternifolia]